MTIIPCSQRHCTDPAIYRSRTTGARYCADHAADICTTVIVDRAEPYEPSEVA